MMWWDEKSKIKRKPLTAKDLYTLHVFAMNDMKIQATADALGHHYNTVSLRLQRIKDVTGFDPRKFYDLNVLLGITGDKMEGKADVE